MSAYESDERSPLKEEKETHLERIIAQREVHYCWSTPTDTLLECSAIDESNAPTKMRNLPREDMRWKIWDELRACGSKAIIRNSRTCRTVTMVSTLAFRETEVSVHNPMYGRGIWYVCFLALSYHYEGRSWRYTHRKSDYCCTWTLVARTILWIHNSVNPKGEVLAAWCFRPQLLICMLVKRLPWLSLYELRIALDCWELL